MRHKKRKRRPDFRYDLKEFRVFMEPLAYKYNDVQLRQLQREMNEMVKILIEFWEIKKGWRNPADPEDPEDFDLGSSPLRWDILNFARNHFEGN